MAAGSDQRGGIIAGPQALRERLQEIISGLTAAAPILAEVPFRRTAHAIGALEAAHPKLAQALLALSDAEVEELETHAAQANAFLASRDPLYARIGRLTDIGSWPVRAVQPTLELRHLANHVPGRKWAQILAFESALGASGGPFVDWCSGKGHLGRMLAATRGARVRCLEHDADLCNQGAHLARSADVRFECVDVITEAPVLDPRETVTALHSCGHLHDALVRRALDEEFAALAYAPCCFHLSADRGEHWHPLSLTGPEATLSDDLVRLAVRETVTAPASVRRMRIRERSFRLGLAALLEASGQPSPVLPSLPRSLFSAGFEHFCRQVARRGHVELPEHADYDVWLEAGRRRDDRIRRLDLARAGFRRVLELRMVLDRALALAERGLDVGVGCFCAATLTPRNLLVQAR